MRGLSASLRKDGNIWCSQRALEVENTAKFPLPQPRNLFHLICATGGKALDVGGTVLEADG